MMDDFLAQTKLFRVGLYLGGLVTCLVYVLVKAVNASRSSDCISKLIFLPLICLVSIALTWKEIIHFIIKKSEDYHDLKTTFQKVEIVVEAYRSVTDSIEGYWWSSQLLMFTIVFILFINTKARQINMPVIELCAYIWLGFGGAISASFSLFLYRYSIAISMETNRTEHRKMSNWSLAVLAGCLWLGFICIVLLYFSVGLFFKFFLLLTHLLLFLPSLLPSIAVKRNAIVATKGFIPSIYAMLCITLACHHFYFTHLTLPHAKPDTFYNVFYAGFSHNCQASIPLDAVLCFLLCTYYIFLKSKKDNFTISIVPFILLSPCLSLGSSFALVMLCEEYVLEKNTEEKTD